MGQAYFFTKCGQKSETEPRLQAEIAAERHERLVKAAKAASWGDRQRLQAMARQACADRMRAELAVRHG